MTQHHHQHTAQIIAFPKRQRSASQNQHAAYAQAPIDPRFAAVEFGSGWYHGAAVEDSADVSYRKH